MNFINALNVVYSSAMGYCRRLGFIVKGDPKTCHLNFAPKRRGWQLYFVHFEKETLIFFLRKISVKMLHGDVKYNIFCEFVLHKKTRRFIKNLKK